MKRFISFTLKTRNLFIIIPTIHKLMCGVCTFLITHNRFMLNNNDRQRKNTYRYTHNIIIIICRILPGKFILKMYKHDEWSVVDIYIHNIPTERKRVIKLTIIQNILLLLSPNISTKKLVFYTKKIKIINKEKYWKRKMCHSVCFDFSFFD